MNSPPAHPVTIGTAILAMDINDVPRPLLRNTEASKCNPVIKPKITTATDAIPDRGANASWLKNMR